METVIPLKKEKKVVMDLPLLLIVLLAAFLNGYGIWAEKYANTYYTTAVASMLQSFSNFFFGSLDSAGSVTVDKPPVTFWVQAAFGYVFGVHGWSVILPQALAGIGSVLLLYRLVKPTFGLASARISALAMACTPIAAAVSRTNNIDSMLVFTLLLGTWLLFKGIRQNSVPSLIGAFAMIGLAFNMKMMQAYMVLPAFYLLYLIAAKINWKKKIALLAGATALMVVISLSWAVIVDSIPADKRPFIGSSTTNSVLELALGYNGVSRLTGNQGPGSGGRGGAPQGATDWQGRAGDRASAAGTATAATAGAGADGGAPAGAPAGGGAGAAGGGAPVGAPAGDGAGGSAAMDAQTGASDAGGAASAASGNAAVGAPTGGGGAAGTGGVTGEAGTDGGAMGAPGGDGRGAAGPDGGAGFGPGQGGVPNGGPGRNGSGGMFGTGQKGPLRLFQKELSGQASWLIPFAAFACVALLAGLRRRNFTAKHKEALFWLAWLMPGMVFFSIAGFFHQYYLIMLAPPIAALVGAGWAEMWTAYRSRSGWLSWLLPAAIVATSAFEWYILQAYEAVIGSGWAIGVAAAGIITALLLITWRSRELRLLRGLALAGLIVLFAGPLFWAATPITYGQNSQLPQAGPGTANSRGGMNPGMNAGMPGGPEGAAARTAGMPGAPGNFSGGPGMEGSQSVDPVTLAYLKAHNTGETYLFAASDYNTAAPYLIDAEASVITLNGFNGSDQVYTTAKLEQLVASGKVKYFMISAGGGSEGGGGRGGNSELNAWIIAHGTEVPASEWKSADTASTGSSDFRQGGRGGNMTLYEVKL